MVVRLWALINHMGCDPDTPQYYLPPDTPYSIISPDTFQFNQNCSCYCNIVVVIIVVIDYDYCYGFVVIAVVMMDSINTWTAAELSTDPHSSL